MLGGIGILSCNLMEFIYLIFKYLYPILQLLRLLVQLHQNQLMQIPRLGNAALISVFRIAALMPEIRFKEEFLIHCSVSQSACHMGSTRALHGMGCFT